MLRKAAMFRRSSLTLKVFQFILNDPSILANYATSPLQNSHFRRNFQSPLPLVFITTRMALLRDNNFVPECHMSVLTRFPFYRNKKNKEHKKGAISIKI
jgi:hypothetical protein